MSRESGNGALEGIMIVDFSRVLAGPLATMTLGDLGADIIKVERPGTGDDTRHWGPPFSEEGSPYYLGLNRNKRSLSLDFGDPEDLDTARRLAERADVVVENFRPGTMQKLGLDYEELARSNPGLVYCSISAFGSGPEASKLPGYDFLVQAASGFMSITGQQGGEPLKTGVAVIDMICGLYATTGILAALHDRKESGKGQQIEVSLMDSALNALLNQASAYLITSVEPGPLGNRHPSIAPYETYQAADRKLALAVGNDALWKRLCIELGLQELEEDERFATNSARVANIDELKAILENVFAEDDAAIWVERLGAAGVPAGLVRGVGEAFAFAEELGLEPTVEVEGNETGAPLELTCSPLRMSRTPAEVRLSPPSLGQHSKEIRNWLGQDT